MDGDLLIARAMAMAADLGAPSLTRLAGVFDELSLAAASAPVEAGADGGRAAPYDERAAASAAVRFAAGEASGRPGEGPPEPAAPARSPATANGSAPAGWRSLARSLGVGPLEGDLARVEAALVALLDVPGRPALTEAVSYVATAGGKRLRPMLTLLGHYAVQQGDLGPAPQSLVEAAAAVEALHVHTLYHDDIMDGAATRRGVPTAVHRWGAPAGVALGNVLCARAFGAAGGVGRATGQLMAASLQQVCRGQSRELTHAYDHRRTERDYLTSIGGKTAFLLGAAARFGTVAGEAAGEGDGDERAAAVADAVWAAAFHIGIAFQVVDDLLDLLGSEVQLHKPVGSDVVEGVYSLPVILALREDPGLARLLTEAPTASQVEELRVRLAGMDAVGAALRFARSRCTTARQMLTECPSVHPEARGALVAFEQVVFRPLVAAGVEVAR
jgi:geranylgeranyl pyrophosphate synthase